MNCSIAFKVKTEQITETLSLTLKVLLQTITIIKQLMRAATVKSNTTQAVKLVPGIA